MVLIEDNIDDAQRTMKLLDSLYISQRFVSIQSRPEPLYWFLAKHSYLEKLPEAPRSQRLGAKLQKKNSPEFFRSFKANSSLKSICALVSTASNEYTHPSIYSDLNNFITKPFRYKEFIKSFKERLRHLFKEPATF